MVVLMMFLFCLCSFLVNFMMRMVFFVDRLMVVNRFIWKNMLLDRLCMDVVSSVLIMFNGIISIIENGID